MQRHVWPELVIPFEKPRKFALQGALQHGHDRKRSRTFGFQR
jgi:hypothetical protein